MVPAAWLKVGCRAVVTGLTQTASVLGVVGVEACVDEVASAVGVVVCDGGGALVAEGADGVASDDCGSEAAVPFGVVAPAAPCLIRLPAMTVTSGALFGGVDLGAAWDRADAHHVSAAMSAGHFSGVPSLDAHDASGRGSLLLRTLTSGAVMSGVPVRLP